MHAALWTLVGICALSGGCGLALDRDRVTSAPRQAAAAAFAVALVAIP